MIQELASGLLGLVLLLYATEYLLSVLDDPREPPRIHPKVPLIGHLLGLVQNGPSYHSQLSNTTNAQVYTLGIASLKLYTTTSTRLLPAIQRQSKTLTFRPMVQFLARQWGDASDATYDIFGDGLFVPEFSSVTRAHLAPGPHLDDQNERMGRRALKALDELFGNSEASKQQQQQQPGRTSRIMLLEWARHTIVQASSCGVYGEKHPFVDPTVEEAFWTWQSYLATHMASSRLDVFGTGYAARQKVFDAHLKYCTDMPEDASQLIKERWRVLLEAGISETDAAKQQSTLPIGMLGSTVPTFYWTIWELFSRPEVLSQVRQELEAQAIVKLGLGGGERGGEDEEKQGHADGNENGNRDAPTPPSFALDVAALKSQCPLLLSVFQETQRIRHVHAVTRKVTGDTLLDDGTQMHLLKEGNYLQVPGNAIHRDARLWGPSAAEFDPYRFVDPAARRPGSNFLAWGAPPHLCPARQFAATEILVLVALLATRADLRPASGSWDEDPALVPSDPITVLNPKRDVRVNVSVRKEWDGKWTLSLMSDSKKVRVPVASG